MSQSSAQEALASVRIVLVAPAGSLNIGSVARVMKNFGLTQLVLVDPQCDPLGAEAMQMAVHAKDVLYAARQVSSVPEALQGCQRAIATTARQRGFNAPLELPEVALPALLSIAPADTALLFGPEDRGLSNEELTYAQQYIKISTDAGYSALNLAQAVAICCYELYRASQSMYLEQRPSSLNTPALEQNSLKALRSSPLSAKQTDKQMESAALDELEGYYQHLEQLLLKVEYLYPHTAHSRMRKFRQLLHRAAPSASEVALLRGILRQVEWALSAASPDSRPDSRLSDLQSSDS
jgi:tRNA/rRNA methyltransferase